MRLIITDTGMIWNRNNAFLKEYKDIVLVVCLGGKKVTDEYECFVVPRDEHGIFLGMDNFGIEDRRFKALASVAGKLNNEFGYHDDLVFLTDNDPSTLYPYYAVKDIVEYNRIHLIVMPPLSFEGKSRKRGFKNLLSDMSKLDSIVFYDINKKLDEVDKKNIILGDFLEFVKNDLGNMMPCFLNGIYHMEERPCYFDFASMKYIPLRNGFNDIDVSKKQNPVNTVDFPLEREFSLLGLIIPPKYPDGREHVKECIERPVARIDGKRVCSILREQRIKLAEANNITFESKECPSIGPCAGTCEKCDSESRFLREEMEKIPKYKRVYPWFDPTEEV